MKRNEKGFTLVELLIVIGIIGILSVIAIPNFMRFQAKAKQTEAKTNLSALYTAEKAYYAEYGGFYTGLVTIGFQSEGANRNYHVGFMGAQCGTGAAVAGLLGPGAPVNTTAPPNPAGWTTGSYWYTADGNNTLTSCIGGNNCAAAAALGQGGVPTSPGMSLSTVGVGVGNNAFVAGACGIVRNLTATAVAADVDTWYIDDARRLVNATNGT